MARAGQPNRLEILEQPCPGRPLAPLGALLLRRGDRWQSTSLPVDVEASIEPDHRERAIWELVGREAWDPQFLGSRWV